MSWVILTMGDRPDELRAAIDSVQRRGTSVGAGEGDGESDGTAAGVDVIVVSNGAGPLPGVGGDGVTVVELPANAGIPGGRNAGLAAARTALVGFLDDDARLLAESIDSVVDAFEADERLAVVSLRLVDDDGVTQRRHVPRVGQRGDDLGGEVVLFLGGACVHRVEAFEAAGGYFADLWYGHEEVELAWRLVDAGWRLRYLPDVEVFHPKTPIERHATGWAHTGRNRVMVARRTLPWPVAIVHVGLWLVLGLFRAPTRQAKWDYLRGWARGWRQPLVRRPIRWRTVVELARRGRPPLV